MASNVTGNWVADDTIDAEYWHRHVLFDGALPRLAETVLVI